MKLQAITRLKAHADGEVWQPGVRDYHYAVGCLLLAADTLKFSFQLRSATSDTPNTYGCWGGGIEGNEEAFQALRRELAEETGYSGEMKIYPLMTYYDQDRGFYYYNNLVVVPKQFEVDPAAEFKEESAGDVWVSYGEWPTPMHPGLKSLFADQMSMNTVQCILRELKGAL